MNVEFVIVLDTHRRPDVSLDELREAIKSKEETVLNHHPESAVQRSSLQRAGAPMFALMPHFAREP